MAFDEPLPLNPATWNDQDLEDEPQRARRPLMMLTQRLWVIAALLALGVFGGSMAFDWLLLEHRTPLAVALSNLLVAVLAGALVFTLLAYGRRQRRLVMGRMEALNEVNHHIRNALQSIAFSTASLKDRKEGNEISEAMARIQWTLHEVLPKVEPSYEPFHGSMRDSRQRPPQD
jgi:hypothetical protein